MKNRRGPSIDPCGTPHVTDLNSEKNQEFLHICTLPPNYESIQFTAAWFTPSALNLEVKILCFTVSNAFCRSNMTIPVY